jgi:hypothetical protein
LFEAKRDENPGNMKIEPARTLRLRNFLLDSFKSFFEN